MSKSSLKDIGVTSRETAEHEVEYLEKRVARRVRKKSRSAPYLNDWKHDVIPFSMAALGAAGGGYALSTGNLTGAFAGAAASVAGVAVSFINWDYFDKTLYDIPDSIFKKSSTLSCIKARRDYKRADADIVSFKERLDDLNLVLIDPADAMKTCRDRADAFYKASQSLSRRRLHHIKKAIAPTALATASLYWSVQEVKNLIVQNADIETVKAGPIIATAVLGTWAATRLVKAFNSHRSSADNHLEATRYSAKADVFEAESSMSLNA